jgi:hypothetical protein
MRRFGTSSLLCLFLLSLTGYAKDPVLSKELLHANYVALGYETPHGFVAETDEAAFISAKILPEDREALNNVRDALRKWKRYIVTIDAHTAELLIAVRSGRLASANGGVRIGNAPVGGAPVGRGGIGIGPVFGGEIGPPGDYLAVYQSDHGQEGASLWKKSEDDGLVGRDPALFENFKHDVESLAKKYPPKH